jgi:hypothetical protein
MRLKPMKLLFWFLPLLVLVGCTTKGGPFESGSYCQVTNDNVLTYGPAAVKVNPSFEYLKTSERLELLAEDVVDANVKKEYHMFAMEDFDKGVVIVTQTMRNPQTFWRHDFDMYQNVKAIDKGKIEIDKNSYYSGIRYFDRFPQPMLAAFEKKGINVEKFRCGLEKGVCRALNRFKMMCVYYVERLSDCHGLSNDSNLISDQQRKSVREFADRFNKNITITHQ